jgi:hypothetical protein
VPSTGLPKGISGQFTVTVSRNTKEAVPEWSSLFCVFKNI